VFNAAQGLGLYLDQGGYFSVFIYIYGLLVNHKAEEKSSVFAQN